MNKIDQMQSLVGNIEIKGLKENIEGVEDTKEREEFRSYLEQTIYEKCLEKGSKIDSAKTEEELRAADKEWNDFAHNCQAFMTRAEFSSIRDKAYNELHPDELNITVETVKELIDKNADLYWKILKDKKSSKVCPIDRDTALKYKDEYFHLGGKLKRVAEKQSQEKLEQIYFELKKDYERLLEHEKGYIIRNLNKSVNKDRIEKDLREALYIGGDSDYLGYIKWAKEEVERAKEQLKAIKHVCSNQEEINKYESILKEKQELRDLAIKVWEDKYPNQLYTCKFKLGGADEDTSNWDESDAEYHEMDLRYFDAFIDKLDAKYDDRLERIDDYRYTVSSLTQDELGELESLFNELENDMDYCWISYDIIEVEAA